MIKLSKLTKAGKVWRGIKDAALPKEFWVPNEMGVRGGIEYGFSSTTTDREQALLFAGGENYDPSTIFEMQMGMIDRGADLAWLSRAQSHTHIHTGRMLRLPLCSDASPGCQCLIQSSCLPTKLTRALSIRLAPSLDALRAEYPHEQEVLLPPLTGIEALSLEVQGTMLVIHSRLSLNLTSHTLEQVLSRRRKVRNCVRAAPFTFNVMVPPMKMAQSVAMRAHGVDRLDARLSI